jgi:hypothetical protein
MFGKETSVRAGLSIRRAVLVLLALLVCNSPAPAQTPAMAAAARTPVAAWTWSKVFKTVTRGLGTQQGMIQFGAVGMFIALSILWWRK